MVYEYCEEIQKSGINRTMFPSSCGSYLEMGLYIQAETENTLNTIFREAGMAELKAYTEGVLTEASAKEAIKKVIDRVVDTLVKFWEGIKAAFEKIISNIKTKAKEVNKNGVLKDFKALDLGKYKGALNKVFEGKELFVGKDSVYNNIVKEIKLLNSNTGTGDIDEYIANPYGVVISKSILTAGKVSNLAEAKAEIKKFVDSQSDKVTGDWVASHKADIINVVEKTALAEINKDYKEAKKAVNKGIRALRQLEKVADPEGGSERGFDFKDFSKATISVDIAFNNCLLYVADLRQKNYYYALVIMFKAARACTAKNKDQVATESALSLDEAFINEAFNW